jgi:hypothetical protein
MKRVLILLFLFNLCTSFDASKNNLRVFVIEINPILTSITNKNLYKSNNGHPYVSEYFSQDRVRALNEVKEDLHFASHGQLSVEIVQHYILNEFPKFTKKMKLLNGYSDYRFDENTYVSISQSDYDKDKGDWFKLLRNPLFNEPGSFTFDYEYILQKYNLVNRRNKNMFDHVWILGIDPLSTYETMMVGSNPFWINGNPINKNCKNFMIASFSISRRDSNLHALGHSFENILNFAFKGDYFSYNTEYSDYTQDDYNKLSYWEKFTLIDINSKNQNSGVGNVHYPFNGKYDYDYSNNNLVYTYWENWLKYPNIAGPKKQYNNNAWMALPGNSVILKDSNQNQDPDRLYVRFWMYLFPHIDGYTKDGFLNNWWKYYSNLDYVTNISADNKNIAGYVNKEIELNYKVYYRSGEIENVKYATIGDNVQINGSCVKFQNNKLIGAKVSKCTVSIYRDGKKVTFTINVLTPKKFNLKRFLD